MSKRDRIPDAWPFQMSDEMAARFCDLSLSQFRALVAAEKLPSGKAVFGTVCIRWLKQDLEEAMIAQYYGQSWLDSDSSVAAATRRRRLDREFGIE